MRQVFKCGHAGKGQYCHRCQQAEALKKEAKHYEDKKDAVKAGQLWAEAQKLLAVPKKVGAVQMPTDPVPA